MFRFNKVFKTLGLTLLAASAISCNNLSSLEEKNSGYGSLTVTCSNRSIDLSSIKFASCVVSGTGIKQGSEPSATCSVTGGKGSISVENIPIGSNRIVTIYGEDSSSKKINGLVLRGVTDISSSNNTVSLDWYTTSLGNVLSALHSNGVDLSSVDVSKIKSCIDSSIKSPMIDSSSIASDYINGSLKNSSSYILKGSTLNVTNYDSDSYSVQVGDPVSKVASSSGKTCTVTDIPPGTWPVYISSGSSFVFSQYMSFSSDSDKTLTIGQEDPYKEKICIHGYNYKYIWTWADGAQGKLSELTQEGSSDWYSIVLDTTSTNFILRLNGGDDWSGKTEDLKAEAGEYWVKDGKVYTSNPDDNEAPILINATFPTSKVSGDFEIAVEASDNVCLGKVIVTIDGETFLSKSISGKNYSEVLLLDSSELSNGSHIVGVTVMDAAGISSKGLSETITTENANVPPVAVISGSSRVKLGATSEFSSSSYDKNGSVVSYSWSVSGGAKITSGNGTSTITVSFPSSETTCTVSLKVQDNEGAWSEEVTKDVNVKDIQESSGDFREESIYFLMTARWYDGDSSNNRYCRGDDTSGNVANNDPPWRGDFKGVIEKLDYIKALGFSAVWITPPVLNRSDYDYHGYHAWDMTKIDPRLESSDVDYQKFIDACHAKGLKVIQDIVLNHSSRYGLDNFFVPKYWGDRDNKYWGKDNPINYYDEYNPNFHYNGIDEEPNSGKVFYNGDLWQKDKPSLPWNPDLSDWGVSKGWNKEQREWYGCQWPDLRLFDPELFHDGWLKNWEDETCQTGTIHEDCIDLNTESAATQKYLIDAYTKYIEMGVDAFRIDTVKHISRNTFNRRFIPAFQKAGGKDFFIFGEVCTKVNEVWNKGHAPLSSPFYTWKERKEYSADDATAAHEAYAYEDGMGTDSQPTSDNAFLDGNKYHTPDYSKASGMNVIDFPMHMNFNTAGNAFNMKSGDKWYNDATWNVCYVDSHDYSPDNGSKNDHDIRNTADDNEWAEDMDLLWTFRGIPCLFYGSEIRFQNGVTIDSGNTIPLASSGRAYYGDHLEGSITATDYGQWKDATGTLKTTMEYPLIPHLARLNRIRRAIPALQKGQYSTENCNGGICFKRRYTDTASGVDSFALVAISQDASFSSIPGGTYIDVVTGDKKVVSEGGSLSTSGCSGQGNLRVYVLQNDTARDKGADGIIGSSTQFMK